ncbi:MAG TPA: CPBP family intramembrane metalloprotease, partial [Rhodobacterales bacterium]|nr:CPBP family intramembrane metalloprotease [Rhodobacterales bacterium]
MPGSAKTDSGAQHVNAFWQPALARNQIWRTLLGTLIVAVVYIAVMVAIFFAANLYLGLPDAALAAPDTPRAMAVFFATFLGIHLGLVLALALLHRRGYASLFGPTRRLAMGHVFAGLAAALAIGGALSALMGLEHLVLPQGTSPPLRLNLLFTTWAAWLAPAIALIFVQILAEEALFRGYLLQQLRARFRSPLIWAILPSVLFGALHFDAATFGVINASAYVLN